MLDMLEKPYSEHIDDSKLDDDAQAVPAPAVVYDAVFARGTMLKVDLTLLPLLTLVYMCSSLNNTFYFISYAPFMVPFALLGKRTRMAKVLSFCAIGWGIAATCFASTNSFAGSYACPFFVGLGEASFSPLIQVSCRSSIPGGR
ncbi:hypothetical protein Q5752_006814 [Cryptotrichosporon argae]